MLLKLRDKVTGGKAAVVIVVVLAIPFAFFGIGNYFTADVDTHVARIELPGKWYSIGPIGRERIDISEQAYQARLNQTRMQMRQVMGDRYDGSLLEDPAIRRQILDQMIEEELLLVAARRDGLAVSDSQVAAEIRSIPAFQVGNQFDPNQYRMTLAAQNPPQTPGQFDARMRQELMRQMIPSGVSASAFATDAEVDTFIRLRDQQRDFAYLQLDAPEDEAVELGGGEVEAWFAANAESYRTPEQVVLEYVEVRASDLAVPTTVDESTLMRRFEEQRARFVSDEQRLTSHILLGVEAGADDASWEETRLRAEELLTQLSDADQFAALAQQHSEDPGSSGEGGDLGWVEPGVFGDDFDAGVFAAEQGRVEGPVRTSDGWHLILVRDIREGSSVAFEDVRDEIEAETLEGERERAFSDLAGRLMDITYRDSSSLQPAAEELGLEIQRTGPFSRDGGSGVAAHPEVVRAAFSDRLLVETSVSGAIELDTNHIVVARVVEHIQAEQIPLEDVRAEVEERMRAERLAERAQAAADAMLARAREGAGLEELAAGLEASVTQVAAARRDRGGVDPAILEEVFSLPRPQVDGRSLGLARLGQRGFVLVEVTNVVDGDPGAVPEGSRVALRAQLGRARSESESNAYIQALRSQYPVRVQENRL